MKRFLVHQFAILLLVGLPLVAADPSVAIVTGPAPHQLEKLAVEEVSTLLRDLFGASVSVTDSVPKDGSVILIGNPESNPAIGKALKWPALSKQGHLLKSEISDTGVTLIVGGGSPAATYWAACELGHLFGVRRLLHADFPPLKKPAFSLAGIELKLEPEFHIRAWGTLGRSPVSPASWSLADHRLRLRQLAKLKFNRLVIPLHPSQPFVADAATGKLWSGPDLRVDGETAGRAAFGRDRVFGNPDFRSKNSEAGVQLVRGIITQAKQLGMDVVIEVKGRKVDLTEYQNTYPGADLVTRSRNVSTLEIGNRKGNILPLFDLARLAQSIHRLRAGKRIGFIANCQLPDDLNTSAFYLSRAGFDAEMTRERAVDELVTPICGEVSKRIAIGFDQLAKASELINKNDPAIATPRKDVIMRHYAMNKPAPEWWAEAKAGFIGAMNEMYRANTRARGGARAYSLYLAKKFEFGLHYFTVLESVRAAGIAKAAKDKEGQLENLDKAVEAMHNAMSAIADVDRNNGDRGIIALFNEYGFRPLVRELEKVDQ